MVRTYLIACNFLSGPGSRGLIGRNETSSEGSSLSRASSCAAWTAWPPRMSIDGATIRTRSLFCAAASLPAALVTNPSLRRFIGVSTSAYPDIFPLSAGDTTAHPECVMTSYSAERARRLPLRYSGFVLVLYSRAPQFDRKAPRY